LTSPNFTLSTDSQRLIWLATVTVSAMPLGDCQLFVEMA